MEKICIEKFGHIVRQQQTKAGKTKEADFRFESNQQQQTLNETKPSLSKIQEKIRLKKLSKLKHIFPSKCKKTTNFKYIMCTESSF